MKTISQNGKIEFLNAQIAKGILSKQDAADFADGKKQAQSDELFIRKQLTGTSGVIEVINENDVTKNCITNLSKGSVPSEKNIVVDKVSIRFGYSVTAVDPAAVAYSNAIFDLSDVQPDAGAIVGTSDVYARRIPVQIQNAEYVLKVDGITMDSGRISDLLTQNVTTDSVNGSDKNFKVLEFPKLFLADKRLSFDVKFPENGLAVPVGNYYIELVAKGLGLGKRS